MLAHPPSGLGLFTQQLFPDRGPVLLQQLRQLLDRHPVHTSASFVGLDSRQCLLAIFPLADLLHQLTWRSDSVLRGFSPILRAEGQLHLLVILPRVALDWYCLFASPVNPVAGTSSLPPSADFRRLVRVDCSIPSLDFETDDRSPEVISTAFDTQPPDLQPVPLMDMDFAINCSLVRHCMPRIRFL
jgi:hypothetical protein